MEVVRRKSDRPPVLLVLVILAAIVAAAVGISALANSPSAKLSRALKRAEKSYTARDYDGAAEAAQEALSLDASSTAAYRILIDTYAKQENYDALCAAYRRDYTGDTPVLHRMRELWSYLSGSFRDTDAFLRAVRKARTLSAYDQASRAFFARARLSEE